MVDTPLVLTEALQLRLKLAAHIGHNFVGRYDSTNESQAWAAKALRFADALINEGVRTHSEFYDAAALRQK